MIFFLISVNLKWNKVFLIHVIRMISTTTTTCNIPTIESLGLASMALCIHSIAQCIAADRGKLLVNTNALPDISHQYLPAHKKWASISETTLGISMCLLIVSCVSCKTASPLSHFLFLWSLAMLMRSATMVSTTLPDSSQKCEVCIPFKISQSGGIKTGSCHDLMFSGHMSTTILACLVSSTYIPILKVPSACIILLQAVSVSASRNHYLVDVLVSIFICTLLFYATLFFISTQSPCKFNTPDIFF